MSDSETPESYRKALARIEEIVDAIENKDLDVDELSGMVQQALSLIKLCKGKLKNAELDLEKALKELE